MSETKTKKVVADPTPELRKMIELVVSLPELGPPLASLAFKLGHKDIGEQVAAMGDGSGQLGVEFYVVRAQAARREKRFADALATVGESIRKVSAATNEQRNQQEITRLLHLVRLGFAVALFDLDDVAAARDMAETFVGARAILQSTTEGDGFFHSLVAQCLWFSDKEASERAWEVSIECPEPEAAWNARGTWYKNVDNDEEKAEATYRKGLEYAPDSPLLLHNLAQLLVDRASANRDELKKARRCCNQADELLRKALRQDSRLRRHIHATRDRLFELRKQLDQGDDRPNQGTRRPNRKPKRPSDKGHGNSFQRSGKMSLGDMLLAKLDDKRQPESGGDTPASKNGTTGE